MAIIVDKSRKRSHDKSFHSKAAFLSVLFTILQGVLLEKVEVRIT